jgi:hypothetical protein
MSSDLVALAVAAALGAVVVVVGLRRNLSETTRNGLRQSRELQEQATVTLGLYQGEERPRRPLSPRQQRWAALGYLVFALSWAAIAAVSAHERLAHLVFAVAWAICALVILRRGFLNRSGGPAS